MIITATELRNNIGKYLSLASCENIYITKSGKTIAILTAPFQTKTQAEKGNTHVISRDEALLILGEAYSGCIKIFGSVKEAYLYGSYARGDYRDDSDVNILITIDLSEEDISEHHWDIAGLSSDLSLNHDVTVNINIKSADQFAKYCTALPLYQDVLKEGIKYEG